MQIIDPRKMYLEKKFFHQEHCRASKYNRHWLKDLNIVLPFVNDLNSPIIGLNKTIIIDNLTESFKL